VGDTILHAAPMSHGSGLYIFPNIAAGAQQVICQHGFDEQEIFDLVHIHPQVSFFAAPTMIHRLVMSHLDYDPTTSNLKSVIYGGGPMYVADIKRAMQRFGNKFIQIYGQGETPMTITSLNKQDHLGQGKFVLDELLASVGSAQLPIEIEIRDADHTALTSGEIGEIVVKGDTVMLGYWQNPDATAKAIIDDWLYTGDLGSLDQHGYLTLKDRSKDMIISGGTNIYPREVEEVLLRHEGISEVAVVGKVDPEWGETVFAFVVPMNIVATDVVPGNIVADTLSEAECDAWCLEHIARFKRPKGYKFVDRLPKNNTGKVLKRQLREQI
jgi:long-chain acyl-CoA synthetase